VSEGREGREDGAAAARRGRRLPLLAVVELPLLVSDARRTCVEAVERPRAGQTRPKGRGGDGKVIEGGHIALSQPSHAVSYGRRQAWSRRKRAQSYSQGPQRAGGALNELAPSSRCLHLDRLVVDDSRSVNSRRARALTQRPVSDTVQQ
jgi:hypothetical protein